MPEFSYRAADNAGRLLEGRIDASDADAATRQLRAQGAGNGPDADAGNTGGGRY